MRSLGASCRIERDYMRPIARRLTKSAPNGISNDIIPFLREMRRIANARVEEVSLKSNVMRGREIAFEIGNHRHHVPVRREMRQHVDMVGHDQEEVQKPITAFLPKPCCVKYFSVERGHRNRPTTVILPFCVNRDEIHRVTSVDANRSTMIQGVANRIGFRRFVHMRGLYHIVHRRFHRNRPTTSHGRAGSMTPPTK